MTLKEKIQTIIIDYYGNLQKILLLEKIADDYAIEFAEWCDDNYFKNGKGNSNWSASMDWDDDEKFTTEELLKIFKKEKGW